MRAIVLVGGLLLAWGVGACGDDDTGAAGDGEVDAPDVGDTAVGDTAADSAAPETTPGDTAALDSVPVDTLVEETLEDTGTSDTGAADTNVEDTSTDTDTNVADTNVADTSTDTSVEDASTDTTPPAQGDNVFAEGSFELWQDGLPVGWVGSATNLGADGIFEDTSAAHDGVRACALVNASDTHKRVSSAPQRFAAGRYTCTYWVRGAGEIRTARYTGDYSSYTSYTTIDADGWREITYSFSLAADVPAFELVFSVRNTSAGRGHLRIDDVSCTRELEPCDTITCESWQTCDDTLPGCRTAAGFCADDGACEDWQECATDHRCTLAPGFCQGTSDCGGATPVCDPTSHTCVAGDPCAGVTCDTWEVCDPTDSSCDVAPGRCESLADCDQDLPTCDRATHTCLAVDAAVNVVPNGGFEVWSEWSLGGPTTYLLPDYWYGLDDGAGAYFPETEIPPQSVVPYPADPHSGVNACQLIDTGAPAERFTTEPFTVAPGATYECAYWVRGHGDYRQRAYCGGWNPDTAFAAIDSDAWQQVRFDMSGSANWCVLIFYASSTVADRDHLQVDDVVCIRK